MTESATDVLRVSDLSKTFRGQYGVRRTRWTNQAVREVSFTVDRGRSLALVGESGSGKTTIARVIVGLETPTSGRIVLEGRELAARPRRDEQRWRASAVQIVFQDPYTSLTPHQMVRGALGEAQRVHFKRSAADRRTRTADLLAAVGLGEREGESLPRQLSGGQRQRAAIARALAVEPRLLILDEPVSALDVSIQAQILNLLADLRRDLSLTYLFITHDLAVVRQVADEVVVMYRGRVIEHGSADDILGAPLHPYTVRLLDSVPRPHQIPPRRVWLVAETDDGCVFRARCPKAHDRCAAESPMMEVAPGHEARCWLVAPDAGSLGSGIIRDEKESMQ